MTDRMPIAIATGVVLTALTVLALLMGALGHQSFPHADNGPAQSRHAEQNIPRYFSSRSDSHAAATSTIPRPIAMTTVGWSAMRLEWML